MDEILKLLQLVFILRTVDGMVCFNCDGLMEGEHCNESVICGPNQVCGITRYLLSNTSNVVYRQQSCIDLSVCQFLHMPVIGRRSVKGRHIGRTITLDSKCCNYILCNHETYSQTHNTPPHIRPTSSTPRVTKRTTPSVPICADDPMVSCMNAVQRGICANKSLALSQCPQTCGLCKNGQIIQPTTAPPTLPTMTHPTPSTLPTSTKSSLATTSSKVTVTSGIPVTSVITSTLPPCADDPMFPCSDPQVQIVTCSDNKLAKTSCPKTCGVCNSV